MWRPRFTILALALVPTVAGVTVGAGGHRPDECRTCEDLGFVPCKKCAKRRCDGAETPLFCSDAIDCADCVGFLALPCKRCDKADLAAFEERRTANRAWLAKMREIDTYMQREGLHHAESEHFLLTYDIRKIDVAGGNTPHGGMHVYLDRLESLFDRFTADLSAQSDEDFFGKTHVMLWSDGAAQEKASLKYTRQPSSTQSKLMGANPIATIHYDKGHLHEEFELHQAVVHQVSHCLLSNVFDGVWPGNIGGGWIDAGLAHYYEVSIFGGVRHYCYVESDTLQMFKFGRWEPEVLKAARAGDALPFLQVTGKHTTELTPEQHMFSWSFVDFVLRAHPGRFGTLARALKSKKALNEATQEALEISPFEFEANWREFVLENYSPKPKR